MSTCAKLKTISEQKRKPAKERSIALTEHIAKCPTCSRAMEAATARLIKQRSIKSVRSLIIAGLYNGLMQKLKGWHVASSFARLRKLIAKKALPCQQFRQILTNGGNLRGLGDDATTKVLMAHQNGCNKCQQWLRRKCPEPPPGAWKKRLSPRELAEVKAIQRKKHCRESEAHVAWYLAKWSKGEV